MFQATAHAASWKPAGAGNANALHRRIAPGHLRGTACAEDTAIAAAKAHPVRIAVVENNLRAPVGDHAEPEVVGGDPPRSTVFILRMHTRFHVRRLVRRSQVS